MSLAAPYPVVPAPVASSSVASPLWTLMLVLCALCILCSASPILAGGLTFEAHDGFDYITSHHRIGNNLMANIQGASPSAVYNVELVDENGVLMASTSVTTDTNGDVTAYVSFQTNVKALNEMSSPPLPYEFTSYFHAEAVLHNRTFSLELLDANFSLVTSMSILFKKDTSAPLFYFSDQYGNPKNAFDDETLYLTAIHLSRGVTYSADFWLVEGQSAWQDGDPLVDTRGYAQSLVFTGTASQETVPVLVPLEKHKPCLYGHLQGAPVTVFEALSMVNTCGDDTGGGTNKVPEIPCNICDG